VPEEKVNYFFRNSVPEMGLEFYEFCSGYMIFSVLLFKVLEEGLEPSSLAAHDFES
jgi:hypothetical protein